MIIFYVYAIPNFSLSRITVLTNPTTFLCSSRDAPYEFIILFKEILRFSTRLNVFSSIVLSDINGLYHKQDQFDRRIYNFYDFLSVSVSL